MSKLIDIICTIFYMYNYKQSIIKADNLYTNNSFVPEIVFIHWIHSEIVENYFISIIEMVNFLKTAFLLIEQ